MKVLHVLNELRASGAEVMLAQAGPVWRERGVQTQIVATGAKLGGYAERLRAADCTIHHLPFAPSPAFLRQLGSLVRRERYDLVHVHPERASFWYALVGRTAGARVLRTVHNVFAYRGLLRTERRLQRGLLRHIGVQTVSVSKSVQANESNLFNNPSMVIHNWVDATSYRPPTSAERERARRELHLESEHIVAVSVGNCAPAKNHEGILHALSVLPSRLPWIYLHAGEESATGDERALARDLSIAERCHFLGRVDSAWLLRTADVYLMPSLHEGLGNAALEALAMGVPSVLGECPGLQDLKSLGLRGVVWVGSDNDSIAQGIQTVLQDQLDESGRWVANAAVRERFGIERGAAEYEQLYRELLRSKTLKD